MASEALNTLSVDRMHCGTRANALVCAYGRGIGPQEISRRLTCTTWWSGSYGARITLLAQMLARFDSTMFVLSMRATVWRRA